MLPPRPLASAPSLAVAGAIAALRPHGVGGGGTAPSRSQLVGIAGSLPSTWWCRALGRPCSSSLPPPGVLWPPAPPPHLPPARLRAPVPRGGLAAALASCPVLDGGGWQAMAGVAGGPNEVVVMRLVSTLLRCGVAGLWADKARALRHW